MLKKHFNFVAIKAIGRFQQVAIHTGFEQVQGGADGLEGGDMRWPGSGSQTQRQAQAPMPQRRQVRRSGDASLQKVFRQLVEFVRKTQVQVVLAVGHQVQPEQRGRVSGARCGTAPPPSAPSTWG